MRGEAELTCMNCMYGSAGSQAGWDTAEHWSSSAGSETTQWSSSAYSGTTQDEGMCGKRRVGVLARRGPQCRQCTMGLRLTVGWPAGPKELGVQISLAQQLVQLLKARPVQHRILAAEHVLQICCSIVIL